jgi:hypothetical protein
MSFKGQIEAKCPNGCEPFEAEVWSYVRGDLDVALRDAVLARELNLVLCPACSGAFVPEEPFVYFEPQNELLAFVFPETYREKEEYWRGKMREDFASMKQGLGEDLTVDVEPEIFFGQDDLAGLLELEDYRGEEREVMEFIAKDLGLALYRVSPRFARRNNVPAALPSSGNGGAPTPESVIKGLESVVSANDRLTAFSDYLAKLKKERRLPPPSAVKSA